MGLDKPENAGGIMKNITDALGFALSKKSSKSVTKGGNKSSAGAKSGLTASKAATAGLLKKKTIVGANMDFES